MLVLTVRKSLHLAASMYRFTASSLFFLGLALSLGPRLHAALAPGDFTIIVLPDTQNEAQFFPSVFKSQTQWIVNQRTALNIQAVLGEGDIVNDGADDVQQSNADAAVRLLDNARIPYFLAIGNHDYDNAAPRTRSALGFNQWFGPSRYAAYSFYKGNLGGSNENFFGTVTANGKPLLILLLEFRPRSSSLDWAESILNANAGAEAIVVTHSYLLPTGLREDRCDTQDMPAGNANGEQMWARFRKHSNVIMVLNGHLTNGNVSKRTDIANNGNLVNQIFTNYQTSANGGNGWLRILTFHPSSNTISVQTYSPFLNQFKTDAANQYTIPYHNPGKNSGSGTVAGTVRDTSTCKVIPAATVKSGTVSATTGTTGRYSLVVGTGVRTFTSQVSGYTSLNKSETVADTYGAQVDFYLTKSTTSGAGCTLSTVSPSVTICTPANNATVTSPVAVKAGTTDSNPVSYIQLYVDGKAVVTQTGGTLNTSATLAPGTRRLTVQAKDSAGVIFKQTINVIAQ